MEEVLPGLLRKIMAHKVGLQVPQFKFVLGLPFPEAAGDLIDLPSGLKAETPAVDPALPGPEAVSVVVLRLFPAGGGKAVEHRQEESREGGLAPAVFPADHIDSLFEAMVQGPDAAEIFNMTFDQSHQISPPAANQRKSVNQRVSQWVSQWGRNRLTHFVRGKTSQSVTSPLTRPQ